MFYKNTLITSCSCTVLPLTSLHTAELSLFLCRQQEFNPPTFRPLKVALGFNQACSGATTSIKDRQTRGPRLLTNEPCVHISQMVKVQIHTAVLPNEQVEGALQANRKQRVTDYKLMQDNQKEVWVWCRLSWFDSVITNASLPPNCTIPSSSRGLYLCVCMCVYACTCAASSQTGRLPPLTGTRCRLLIQTQWKSGEGEESGTLVIPLTSRMQWKSINSGL